MTVQPARAGLAAATALLACSAALALERSDFAWQWPLDTGGEDGLLALTLTAEVYRQAQRADLRDVAAFNAAGVPVPFGPAAPAQQRAQAVEPAAVPVPLFVVPRTAGATAGRAGADAVALHIHRAPDGRLRQLDATVVPGAGDAGAGAGDLLLDVSALERPVHALQLTLAEGAAPLDARVTVEGSHELGTWQPLARERALVALDQNGFRLERTRIALPATELPYLRLRRTDADAALPVQAVAVLPVPVEAGLVAPAREWLALPGTAAPLPQDAPGSAFAYHAGGPFPVGAVDVVLADLNAVADVVVLSRDADDAPWRERARFTAFRLGGAGNGIGNAEVEVGSVRDRHWRVATLPAQARAPELRLAWTPDRMLLSTQGEAPFLLAAGSARGLRPEYPLGVALARLQAERGEDWQPPQARLGTGAPLTGQAALQARAPTVTGRQVLLWTVLVGGALVLVAMVLRLLRRN